MRKTRACIMEAGEAGERYAGVRVICAASVRSLPNLTRSPPPPPRPRPAAALDGCAGWQVLNTRCKRVLGKGALKNALRFLGFYVFRKIRVIL